MKYFNLLIVSALFMFQTSNINAADDKNISFSVPETDRFEVFFHRVQTDATSAIFFGLLGAAVDEGVQSNKDAEKKLELLAGRDEPSCADQFIQSFTDKLSAKDYSIDVSRVSDATQNHTKKGLWLNIKNVVCGFKVVNTQTSDVLAFMSFQSYLMKDNKKLAFDENHMVFSKKEHQFFELTNSSEKTQQELSFVLNRAGRKLANKIIYRKESDK